jgi:large subunit ribosomal protein L17e
MMRTVIVFNVDQMKQTRRCVGNQRGDVGNQHKRNGGHSEIWIISTPFPLTRFGAWFLFSPQGGSCCLFTVESITTLWEPRWFSSILSKTAILHGFPNVILKTFASFVFERPQPIGSARPGVSRWPSLPSKSRLLFKRCREIAHHTKVVTVSKVLRFLDDVLAFKSVISFVKYTGGCGRKAQAKQFKVPESKGRWPVKATAVYRDLVRNAAAYAETKGLEDAENCIEHAQCNRAPPGRRRTYRAHGTRRNLLLLKLFSRRCPRVSKRWMRLARVKISKKMAAMHRFVKVGAA